MVNWQKCNFTASSEAPCQTVLLFTASLLVLVADTSLCYVATSADRKQTGGESGHLGGIRVRTAEHISDVATLKLISPLDKTKAVKPLEIELV